MSQETIDFYDRESEIYSLKRYVSTAESYTQFFFNDRWRIVEQYLRKIVFNRHGLTLLDVACADGVITQKIVQAFPENFSMLIGNDIAPHMVDVANRKNKDSRINFVMKDQTPSIKFDVCLGLGFISGNILKEEIDFTLAHLKEGGIYICSLVSRHSIFSVAKLRSKYYYKDYWSYRKQEQLLKKNFQIEGVVPHGFLIPWLWKWPALARRLQPVIEVIFRFLPNLYQEKVYLLSKRV